jgi:hypothetical protein
MNFRKTFKMLVLFLVTPIFFSSLALAAKPDGSGGSRDIISKSNGFPSGEHFNLNLHGKKADYQGDPLPGGNSVFILEYGVSTIEYITNKKSSVTELTAIDPLAEAFDGDSAQVQIPYEAEGYYVFGRILGKPNNGNSEPESSIILYQNSVISACNDTDPANPDFPDYTECSDDDLLALGLIVGSNLYTAEEEEYVRFDPNTTKGKGKSKATDITRLFTYTGWVIDAALDTDGPDGLPDGVIDINDVPVDDYDNDLLTDPNRDYNNNGSIDEFDVEDWLIDMAALEQPLAWYYAEEWIMNIADLVITEQGLVNDGTKLMQVRFYPVDTTTFTAE